MRTAGKRPKALPARRIRTRDSRFVPTLTDRPQPAPWTAPSASLSASTHAACGDFQEPLSARPDRCLCKKIFFSRSAGCPVATRFSPVFFPARTAHPSVPCCLHSFPLCRSRRRHPPAHRPVPCFPSSYKGKDLPAPHPGNPPPTQKTSPNGRPAPTSPPQLQYPIPSSRHPNRRPRRTREPYAPGTPAAAVDSKGKTPGDPRARGIRRPHAPLALTRTKVFAWMGARGKGSLFQKASLPPRQPPFLSYMQQDILIPGPSTPGPLAFPAQIGQRCGQQKEMA